MGPVPQIDTSVRLTPGDPAPSFIQRSVSNPRFTFDTAAGRYLVLCFYGTAADPHGSAAIAAAHARPDIFDDARASFFGVSADPEGEMAARLAQLREGFLALASDQREALHLVALEGLSVAEAAAILGIPHGTLMSRVGRARAALRAFEDGTDAAGTARSLSIVGGRDER